MAMEINDHETLINLKSKTMCDELPHIPSLFCIACTKWVNFYISDNEPHCECCREHLTPTKEDLESASKFLKIYPRSACIRLKRN